MEIFSRTFYCLLIVASVLKAGDTDRVNTINPIFSFGFNAIGSDVWAVGGAGVVKKSFSSALHNPALLNGEDMVFYAEAGYDFKTKDILGLDLGGQFILPAFATFILPYGDYTFSLGYSKYYSFLQRAKIAFTTIENVDEPDEYFNFKREVNVYNIFASASTTFSDDLSAGLTVGFNRLSTGESFGLSKSSGKGNGFLLIAGVDYNVNGDFSIAANFKYLSEIEYEETTKPQLVHEIPDGDFLDFVSGKEKLMASFPVTFSVGARYSFSDMLKLYASFEHQNWPSLGKDRRDLNNIHLGLEYIPNANAAFSLGYFSKTGFSELFDQYFVTLGLSTGITENITLNMVGISSELLGTEKRETVFGNKSDPFHQSYVSIGLAVNF